MDRDHIARKGEVKLHIPQIMSMASSCDAAGAQVQATTVCEGGGKMGVGRTSERDLIYRAPPDVAESLCCALGVYVT